MKHCGISPMAPVGKPNPVISVISYWQDSVLVSFPLAVIKYSDKRHLGKKGLFWLTVLGTPQRGSQGGRAGSLVTSSP